ncbi:MULTISPECIES: M14 family zinc carboxypeptidase [unclassified Nocardioides]|uniref:M14 family zinc carboxypeptidase n=1 Tax=unclassified Nocardioides TaxID=2615069 RepID=UPI001E4C6489|nr:MULTISPECIES: M14 family zinc carboxypeptidase [unclassified Nocardioides]
MTKSRALVGLTGFALVASVTAGLSPATALDPPSAPTAAEPRGSGAGRGPATATRVDPLERAEVARSAAAAPVAGSPLEMPTSYPFQPRLRFYRDNPDDAAHTAALLGHPDLAPRLTELMKVSDRISVQVVGQSTEGRDLYLVTLTAPERAEDTAQQTAWRDKIKNDPTAAAADKQLLAQYKTPIWISNNIHGNEWEGTDGALRYIEHLATAPLSEVGGILRNNRVYFSPSLNPDGRTNATRATALGLDPNRDMITNTTPETRSFIRTAQAIQPIYAADFHGYTSVLQLEPCGPPHGSNYEYDLYIPHNYALSLAVEQRVVDAAIPGNTYYNVETGEVVPENTGPETAHVKIPYRDTPDGWDDFPPIFTAQYAAFYGAASATVELPLTRGAAGGTRQTPERAVVNVEVAEETMAGIVDYLDDSANAREMLLNQIETFRRGVAGEPKTALTEAGVDNVPGPSQWKELWDVVDDQEPVTLPRAYVIPKGEGQRSASDAARLVRQLLLHDIEVGTLDAPTSVGGTTYPAGSWVVDMHQPLRGLANSLLDLGDDISSKVPSMYDISAWSLSYLWGATVDKVGLTTDAPLGATTPIEAPASGAAVPDGPDHLSLELAGVADFQALNALLEDGVAVSMLTDGVAVVEPAGYDEAAAAAEEYDVAFEAASEADLDALDDPGTRDLQDLTIAYVGTQDDRLSLTELGFDDLVQVTAASLETTPALLEGVDAMWIGSAFNPAAGSVAHTRVQALLDDGGALVGRSTAAFNAAQSFGLLTGTAVAGNRAGNGIVAVDTPADSLFAAHPQDASFIYPAAWFTGLGAGVKVEQRYGADPLLAGHWRQSPDGAGGPVPDGPASAAGQASVVSAEAASGARTVVFGTSVFFRNHPKGGLSQAATALFWAAPEGAGVVAPGEVGVTIEPVAKVTYPGAATVRVSTSGATGPVDGIVELLVDGRVVATGPTTGGTASLRVPGLRPGATSVVARFTPSDPAYDVATSAPVTVRVAKAASRTALKLTRVDGPGRGQVAATVRVVVPRLPAVGTLVLSDRGRVVRTLRLTAADAGSRTVRLRLGAGRHVVKATFAGTALVKGSSASRTVTLR